MKSQCEDISCQRWRHGRSTWQGCCPRNGKEAQTLDMPKCKLMRLSLARSPGKAAQAQHAGAGGHLVPVGPHRKSRLPRAEPWALRVQYWRTTQPGRQGQVSLHRPTRGAGGSPSPGVARIWRRLSISSPVMRFMTGVKSASTDDQQKRACAFGGPPKAPSREDGPVPARQSWSTISVQRVPPSVPVLAHDAMGHGGAVLPPKPGTGVQSSLRRRRRSVSSRSLDLEVSSAARAPNVEAQLGGRSGVGPGQAPVGHAALERRGAPLHGMLLPHCLLLQLKAGTLQVSRLLLALHLKANTQQVNGLVLALLVLATILVVIAAVALYSRLALAPQSDQTTAQQWESPKPGKDAPPPVRRGPPDNRSLPILLSERSVPAMPVENSKFFDWRRSASSCSVAAVPSQGPTPRSPGVEILCPGLVVPERMEFVFAVREVLNSTRQQLSFSIVDLKGQALSHIVVNETRGQKQCGIHLQTLDGACLAWVRTDALHEHRSRRGNPIQAKSKVKEFDDGGSCCMEICRPSGEVFCVVAKDEGIPRYRYNLRGRAWQSFYTFYGNFHQKAVNVTNSARQLVCTTERCSMDFDAAPHYRVRVAPQTDAGLLLCGLLSIEKLEEVGQSF